MQIIKFIIRRLFSAIPTLLVLIFLVFVLVRVVPGNPFQNDKALSPQVMQQLLHQYHLDLPIWQQFILYLTALMHGDFGNSYKFIGEPINDLLFPESMGGFWVTLRLSAYAMGVTVPLGFILGCYAGLRRNSLFDKIIVISNILCSALPIIVTGPLMVLIFAVTLHWLPASGFGDGDYRHLLLPVTALVMAYTPIVAIVTRGSIIEVLQASFIRTARAKGMPTWRIMFYHAIKPTLIPVVSVLGPMFASVLVGAIVTEQVFALPGLGILTTNAAINRDYNLILAITILGSVFTIGFNLLVDIVYFILDPQIYSSSLKFGRRYSS